MTIWAIKGYARGGGCLQADASVWIYLYCTVSFHRCRLYTDHPFYVNYVAAFALVWWVVFKYFKKACF